MSCTPISSTDDHSCKKKDFCSASVIPRPINRLAAAPMIIILTPDLDDPLSANSWQTSFARYAANFQKLGAYVEAAPWSTAPLSSGSSSFIYIANLTWGYHLVPDRWNNWLRAWPSHIRLINSPKLLAWNTQKTYLRELEAAGVPVIPTIYVEHVDEATVVNAAAQFGVVDLIIKPEVSASSHNTMRVLVGSDNFTSAPKSMSTSEAVAELNRVAIGKSMMIQPFIANIYSEGEISVRVFGGEVSHAVVKTVSPDDYRVQTQHGGKFYILENLASELLTLAHVALAACPETPVYARVDILRNNATGILSVIELELIEPALYLDYAPDGGMAFAHVVLATAFKENTG